MPQVKRSGTGQRALRPSRRTANRGVERRTAHRRRNSARSLSAARKTGTYPGHPNGLAPVRTETRESTNVGGRGEAPMEGKERGQAARFVQAASRCNLRRLVLLRNLAIIGLTAAVVMDADGYVAIQISIGALASVTGFLALLNLATYWRLQRLWPVTDLEVLGHILADIGVFAGLLYFTAGGVSCVVAGGLIAYIVGTIATLLHEQGRILAEARRRELSQDYLVRVDR